MGFRDLHLLREEMDGYAQYERVDEGRVLRQAGEFQTEREWRDRDRALPKTKFQLLHEKRLARVKRVLPYAHAEVKMECREPSLPQDLDELRALLALIRASGHGGIHVA